MSDLKILQEKVASYLKKPHCTDENFIHAPQELSAQQSIDIYRNSFCSAFINVLRDTFPVCKKIVGEDFFKNMAKCYIDQQPSFSANIDHYGKFFPEFIRDFPHTQSLPYLGDTAELEWLLQCVAEGENQTTSNISALKDLNEDQQQKIIFHIPINTFLFSSQYPIDAIWEFNQDYYQGPEQLTLENKSCFLIVWRPQTLALFELITQQQWLLLQQLKNNVTLENLCAHFSTLENFDLEANLSVCVSKGWVHSFSI